MSYWTKQVGIVVLELALAGSIAWAQETPSPNACDLIAMRTFQGLVTDKIIGPIADPNGLKVVQQMGSHIRVMTNQYNYKRAQAEQWEGFVATAEEQNRLMKERIAALEAELAALKGPRLPETPSTSDAPPPSN